MGKTLLLKKINFELAHEPHIFPALHHFRSTMEDATILFVASLGELVRGA